MATSALTTSLHHVDEVRNEQQTGFGPLVVYLAEFRRAAGAERRYEELQRANAAARPSEAVADVSRRIFEEFYAF